MHRFSRSSGFSLVELSITLIIIALIIAAIASGGHLMQAAQINKIISEITGYKQAVENFKLKYHNLPGDQPNASQFWADVTNGNGDEKISEATTESLQAWTHLSKAKLISGNYTGLPATPNLFEESTNVPPSTIKGAYYTLSYLEIYPQTGGKKGNALQLVTTENNTSSEGGAISASDARIIDKKLDETINPADGNLLVLRSASNKSLSGSCVSSDYTTTTIANYVTDDKLNSCRLLLWLN
jgi:prepilin-type N-terminal cleavage/methylation domain-containing protein